MSLNTIRSLIQLWDVIIRVRAVVYNHLSVNLHNGPGGVKF